ncbi:uncharacterized protein LOC112603060 [Melanaphis sacchari]|uniref:uncharacterized protein LOC112603060 n=1 Tax=Melanaphis sacchari TaxID=742174 RepID=UPI000DC13672|nr:uncharacterized protein LOC112603060 [Melanaphis sacchari]
MVRQQVAVLLNEQARGASPFATAAGTTDIAAPVLAEIREINSKLTEEGEIIKSLVASAATNLAETARASRDVHSGQWTEVVKRRPALPKIRAEQGPGRASEFSQKRFTTKKKPPAFLVRAKEGEYTEVLKRVKESELVKKIADSITALTKTKDGNLLVRFTPGEAGTAPMAKALGEAVGDRERVKEMAQFSKIVVQDLDELASPEEVVEAICSLADTNLEEVKVNSTMEQLRGQKWVIVSIPATTVNRVLSAGKLRVGYVNCRVRIWEDRGRVRCFRCLRPGHMGGQCSGPDRSQSCRRCGDRGHRAVKCDASSAAAKEFAGLLEGNGASHAAAVGQRGEPVVSQ